MARRDKDERAIYSRALQAVFASNTERPEVIVTLDSLTMGLAYGCHNTPCSSPEVDSHVDRSTLVNYRRAMRERGLFPVDVPSAIQVRILRKASVDSFPKLGAAVPNAVDRHDQPPDPFWDEFRRRYPEAWGLTTFSSIGFNDRGDQALLQVRHGCGSSCSYMESMFFEKRYENWMLESRFPEEARDWIGQGNLRFIGPEGRMRQRYFRVADSTAMAKADSILRDNAPRRIRGVVINTPTGRTVSSVLIFPHSAYADTLHPAAPAVADSLGRFEIRDQPIGGLMLVVQCPGTIYRHGGVLAAPGMYVFPAMDTTIVVDVPNIAPCWMPRKIHEISSGEMESDIHRNSPFPPGDEALVYEAALRHLFPRRSDRDRVVVSAYTEKRCALYDCDLKTIPRLARAGLVDSTAIVDFSHKALEVVPISFIFAGRSGTRLLSSGERAYLRNEGLWTSDSTSFFGYNENGFWSALARSHFRANTIVSFTRVGWNAAHSEALVRITQERGDEPERTTLLMRLRGKQWIVIPSSEIIAREKTIDISGSYAGDRCVEAKPRSYPTLRQLTDLQGRYTFALWENRSATVSAELLAVFVPDTTGKPNRLLLYAVIDRKTGLRSPYLDAEIHFSSHGSRLQSVSGMMMFDGSQTYLNIKTISQGALFGSWGRSSFGYRVDHLGNEIPDPSGFFCAVRIGPE